MPESKDTLLRLFALLGAIPRAPAGISSGELLARLKVQGFSVSQRSIQRDLNKLSSVFPLIDGDTTPYRWSFRHDAALDLVAMDTPLALGLYLAESHLENLLPHSILEYLTPQFIAARRYLDNLGHNSLAQWATRVRTLPNGKALLPAVIEPSIWTQVSTALLDRKQLRVEYKSRSKEDLKTFTLHPAGLVSRHSISYLIANVDGYDDYRQFALHRIMQASIEEHDCREQPDFNVDNYLNNGSFNNPAPVEMIKLVADVAPQIAWLLGETPLSPNQTLEPLAGSDWQRLRAQVPNDQETLWWVFGLGENMRVQQPAEWVERIRMKIGKLSDLYEK